MKFWMALFLLLTAFSTIAKDWHCSNHDMEISCVDGRCESNPSFTPVQVDVGENGIVKICAYSGCWDGASKLTRVGSFLATMPQNLKSPSANIGHEFHSAAIVIDVDDKVGVLKFGGFAQPMVCQTSHR
jgi:hypothetical protein